MGKTGWSLCTTCVLALIVLMTGCGGGGGGSSDSGGSTSATTQSVDGVATPSSVSVVTANNAGN